MPAAAPNPKPCKILFDLDPDLQAPLAARLAQRGVPLPSYLKDLVKAEAPAPRKRRRRP